MQISRTRVKYRTKNGIGMNIDKIMSVCTVYYYIVPNSTEMMIASNYMGQEETDSPLTVGGAGDLSRSMTVVSCK